MSVEILEFSVADIPEALELWRRSEGMALTGDTPEALAAYLARNPGLSFVARDGGVLVAAVLCGHDGRRGYLHHLAVAPAQRRRGIATALARRCLEGLEALGVPKCHLFVQRGNQAALAFWRRAGWAERGDLVMMSRTLRAQG
jgi:ribosomal protein S18 acetylase RimI-like enzyme